MHPPENLYHQNITQDPSRSSCSLNRCNLSPWIISSEEFQENPLPIEIDGARATDRSLFDSMDAIADVEERCRLFQNYVSAKFGFEETSELHGKAKPVYNYADLLLAWGSDSNRRAGAVLKAWVESRFGILATYHRGHLSDNAEAQEAFTMDRMNGSAKTIGVLMQLDMLYTFCQDELRRRFPTKRCMTLYRGTHDPEEYAIRKDLKLGDKQAERKTLVQLNNLSSFTSDPEVAWEFGSNVWEAEVPFSKIVFFSGLLKKSLLMGESEHLVLGGYYHVRTRLY